MVVMYVHGAKIGTLPDDPDVLAKCLESGDPVELRTDEGRRLGQFVPQTDWEPNLSEEEILQRIQEPGSSTLAEFWARMGSQ